MTRVKILPVTLPDIELKTAFIWLALLGGATALRLWHIDAALWYDEAFSAWLAQLPLRSLILATVGDVHPPGYYLLLWAINGILGHSEAVLRLPSLLAGLGLVLVVCRLSHTLDISPWPGAIITALAPFQIYYSQEARSYAILSLCVALVALGLFERRPWLAIGSSIVALGLHNMAAVFVGSVWVGFAFYDWPFTRKHGPIALAGSLPAIAGWTAYQALNNVGQGYWIPPLNNPGRIIATYDDLLFFSPNNPFVFASGIITALFLVLILFDLRFTIYDLRFRFLLTTAFLPMVIVGLVSIVWQPVLISRVMAPIAPFYYLLIVRALSSPGRRWFAAILAGPVLVMVLLVGPLIGNVGRQDRDKQMIDLYGQFQPGDGLYHANVGSYVVWQYYRLDIPQYLWPQATTIERGLSSVTRQAMGMNEASFEAVQCQANRWWLIYFHNPTTTQAEMDYIDHLTTDYPSKKIALLRQDVTVEAWLVLLEPTC